MGLYANHVAKLRDSPTSTPPKIDGRSTLPARRGQVASLLLSGMTIMAIADQLGVNRNTIRVDARSPEVVAELEGVFKARRNAAARVINVATHEALLYLRETMNDPANTTKERIKCACELLDRGGFGRGVKLDIHNSETGTTIEVDNVGELTDEEIETAARIALERRSRALVPA